MTPQADPKQLIEHARRNGYAVGAYNMHNEETTEALVWAAERAQSPIFLQVGRAIIPHMGVRRAFEMTRRVAERSNAKYVIHLDHGSWDEVLEAVRLGFSSVMYDGAHLPFEENIATTRRLVEIAHAYGIPVEAELGKIPDAGESVNWEDYYTDVEEARRFVAETGIDYLAISVGIVHGVIPGIPQAPISIQRIREIKAATGIPLVLHGASGLSDREIQEARAAGIHKFNADTDLRHAFRAGLEAVFAQGDRQLEEAMAEGRSRMIEATMMKMRQYGCAGAAPLAKAA
ncbi:MAG: ketose-bisphosphate aldolase [Rhizobiales bacterium 63-7]|uniref:class II fructose-bisphosphate aldolase n=1 Tax=Rhizobium sp. YJ-22 TaxID=3037556 RepID=UPI000925935D|nr:class II fructose-bisphosphate aldolase [Rhizobium sp. YJ-22]MBN9028811.1 class II fructose-bisphosphate aldolase [Hyphomicrobiales bacterium]MDG3576476.1 class II fructose-bisphosphate aldolase [Rhizobium sp. YJ-22]OJU70650.1 MAG: ketose-bisphosphate aldolase [Rhizobiales bacterium 63-7]